jgi:hypothetical protein
MVRELITTSVPPNVSFFIDDIEADWTYTKAFDFIYLRAMTGSVRNWPRLFNQAFKYSDFVTMSTQ